MARRQRSASRRRRAVLSRSPHPQRPSRPHGCLDRLLRKTVQLPPDPLLRHRGPRLRPVLARADQPGRQDPDSDQRGCRRFRPDRGISQRLSRRRHPAHRLRRAGYLPHRRDAARRRPAVHAVAARNLFREDRRAAAEARRGRRAAAARRHPDRRRRRGRRRPDQGAAADLLGQRDRADLLRIHPAQGRRRFWRGQFQGAVRIDRGRSDPPRRAEGGDAA